MKRNKREAGGGVRATGVGQPSNPPALPAAGPHTANCGASGGGLVQGTLFPAAILPSSSRSPLLLMQPCRCSTNMNVVRARPRKNSPALSSHHTSLCRTCRGLGPLCQVEPPCLSPCTLQPAQVVELGFLPRPAKRHRTRLFQGTRLCQGLPGGGGGGEREREVQGSAHWMPSILCGNKLKSSDSPPLCEQDP